MNLNCERDVSGCSWMNYLTNNPRDKVPLRTSMDQQDFSGVSVAVPVKHDEYCMVTEDHVQCTCILLLYICTCI
jgi:hypothetical protein